MTQLVWLNFFKTGLAHKSAGDIVLGLAGIGLAGTSAAFAAYMIAYSDGSPRINAADKLAIFAQPASVPYTGGYPRSDRPAGLDMMPVGTLRPRAASVPAAAPVETVAAGFHMRGYSQGEALVQGPEGFVTVRVGDMIDGLGRVTAIQGRGRSLVVITTGGVIPGDD